MSEAAKQNHTGWLTDGTKVEVIRAQRNEIGIIEYQIKPCNEDRFPSGINPWIPKYAVFDYNPLEGEPPTLEPNPDLQASK